MRTLTPAFYVLSFALCFVCHGIAKAEIVIFAPEPRKAQHIKEELSNRLSAIDSLHSTSVNILITIGTSAYSAELPTQDYYALPLFLSPYSEPHRAKERTFPVYSEPDPRLLVEHLAVWFKGGRVGYLYAADDPFSTALAEAAADSNITLVSEKIGARDIFGAINDLTKENISALLISKNPALYTNSNIRFVLEALYRKRIPAVATTQSLLNAGAIATISTDQSAVLNDVVETVALISRSPSPPGDTESIELQPFSTRIIIKTNKTMEDRFGIYLHEKEGP